MINNGAAECCYALHACMLLVSCRPCLHFSGRKQCKQIHVQRLKMHWQQTISFLSDKTATFHSSSIMTSLCLVSSHQSHWKRQQAARARHLDWRQLAGSIDPWKPREFNCRARVSWVFCQKPLTAIYPEKSSTICLGPKTSVLHWIPCPFISNVIHIELFKCHTKIFVGLNKEMHTTNNESPSVEKASKYSSYLRPL